jgi:integrase
MPRGQDRHLVGAVGANCGGGKLVALPGRNTARQAVRWRSAVAEIGRDKLRVHDLRHTYAWLSRRAGADLRLLQKAIGHASITVTAHT